MKFSLLEILLRHVKKQPLIGKNLTFDLHYNLTQLTSEPTHFTENSSSITDSFFMSREDSVQLRGVEEPILDLNIRYHCPIHCALNLNKHKSTTFTRHIWLYDRGDWASFANEHQTVTGIY